MQAIHRLEPREEPHPIDEIDPLSRGSLMHEIQFALFSSLRAEGLLPLHQADPAETRRRLERALEQLRGFGALEAAKWRDLLAPAIERVWLDCVSSILGDLSEWLRRVSLDAEWIPEEFERSFGLTDAHARDARSQREPAQLEGGLQLRGSIDLVERSRSGVLRATDYKSGRRRAEPGIVIDGGKTLQPVLYALALEQLFPGAKIEGGQLYYCTHTGEYARIPVPLDEHARGAERLLAKTVGEALRDGFFPAAPRKDECKWCDYVEICGDGEEARAAGKSQERLVQLNDLRGSP